MKNKKDRFPIKFNKESGEYSFGFNSYEENFKFNSYLYKIAINGNSIAVYFSTSTSNVVLVHEYYSHQKWGKVLTKKENDDLPKGANDYSSLALVLDKLFGTNFYQ